MTSFIGYIRTEFTELLVVWFSASKVFIFSIVSKSKIMRIASSDSGRKMSRTSPRRLNSPRTLTRGTLVYPIDVSFSAVFTVSICCPTESEKQSDFIYSGDGAGVCITRCGMMKMRGANFIASAADVSRKAIRAKTPAR